MDNKIPSWQQSLAQAFSDLGSLCDYLQIDPDSLPLLTEFKNFPLRVPRGFAKLMQPGDANDPLLRQVLPVTAELDVTPGYSHDPVGDIPAIATEGVIQKYHGRVLLIMTGACAIHCRYCFRRNFPYAGQQLSGTNLQSALDFIAGRTDLTEVILSGGDPLLLNDDKFGHLITQLNNIPHLQRIRIHSRVPVVLPSRITAELLAQLSSCKKQVIMVLHANHSNELSTEVGEACEALSGKRITLLNQSVLLKGVNDDGDLLCQLSERLFRFGILPYYLHILDKASGTAHFAVDERSALALMDYLRRQLPGYLVPRLVQEQAGAAYKIPVFAD